MDPNEGHGHDGFSVKTLKDGSLSIIKPLRIIFCNCVKFGNFPGDWEKEGIVPVDQKDKKQIFNKFCPIPLVPICSKVFEKLLYDAIFAFIIDSKLLNSTQPSFKPSFSCVNQLLIKISITYSIFSAFDANPFL